MRVKVEFNKSAVKARVEGAKNKGLTIITDAFVKDANFYCRQDSGELMRSAIRVSEPEKGRAIWDTPYAKRMYYTGTPAKDVNPNASLMWGHKAALQNNDKYQRMLQKIIDQEV